MSELEMELEQTPDTEFDFEGGEMTCKGFLSKEEINDIREMLKNGREEIRVKIIESQKPLIWEAV